MVAVIIPSMILEIFTVYAVWKAVTQNLSVEYAPFVDVGIWVVILAIPKTYAIYIAAKTADKAKHLNNMVEKYSSYCSDDADFRDVCAYNLC